jgi:hypothetical protein
MSVGSSGSTVEDMKLRKERTAMRDRLLMPAGRAAGEWRAHLMHSPHSVALSFDLQAAG